MSDRKPLILVFAGPNASVKSTITQLVDIVPSYINADDIVPPYINAVSCPMGIILLEKFLQL